MREAELERRLLVRNGELEDALQRLGAAQERIVQAHVERAKQLLMRTDEPMLAVALDSGFSSASKLSTVFRRHVGLTPVEFRRRYRTDRA